MTVGLAALCRSNGRPAVLCASDRMITSGDIQFEPPALKIYPLTVSIVMLTAGDSAAQTDIVQGVRLAIYLRLESDKSWISVKEVADFVSQETASFVANRAARTVLQPLGLIFQTFVANQTGMRTEFFDRIMRAMGDCRPDNETIVAGVDQSGSHIYEIDKWGDVICQDAAGFVAIGAGRRHAESQFMFARHASWKELPATSLLTYTAKRRSEVAPGVGVDTDMCIIVNLGGFVWLTESNIGYLKGIYDHMRDEAARLTEGANARIENDFREIAEAQAAQAALATANEQGATAPSPTPSIADTEDSSPGPVAEASEQNEA